MKNTFMNLDPIKKKRIVEGALKEFSEHGYKEASTNTLVKELGISKGSLFKYFESKLDLYQYIIDLTTDHLLAHMEKFQRVEKRAPMDSILAYAEWEYDYLVKNPQNYRLFYHFQKDLNLPELANIKSNITEKANEAYKNLSKDMGLMENEDLHAHIFLLLNAYNKSFMDAFDSFTEWSSMKEAYMEGLRKHLRFVDWSVK